MTTTQYDYAWITDAGHGWLRVDRSEYKLTGFQASGFSYADESSVYLEEDCDAPRYLAVHKGSLSPRSFPVHHYNGLSPIRDMEVLGFVKDTNNAHPKKSI